MLRSRKLKKVIKHDVVHNSRMQNLQFFIRIFNWFVLILLDRADVAWAYLVVVGTKREMDL